MPNVNFFTPISFGDRPKSRGQFVQEKIDSYFYLRGKKAYVLPASENSHAREAVLSKGSFSIMTSALKIASYMTIVAPLAMLAAKGISRSISQYRVVDVRAELEKGIEIPSKIQEELERLLPTIKDFADDEDIEWISKANNLVFSLKAAPDLVFKMAQPYRNIRTKKGWANAKQLDEKRFANSVKAKEICLAHGLDLLEVPATRKIEIGNQTINAEKRQKISSSQERQEDFYYELSGLNRTVKQLTTFGVKARFSDIAWRNIPILDDDPEYAGDRRVALIDVEEMESARVGIFGSKTPAGVITRTGLINCLTSEEQIDIALKEAKRCGMTSRKAKKIKADRLEGIHAYNQLQAYYKDKSIIDYPNQPIQVDFDTLNLDLDRQATRRITTIETRNGLFDGKTITDVQISLAEAVQDVVNEFNRLLQRNPEEGSIKRRRQLHIDTFNGNLSDSEWLPSVLEALKEQGCIFNFKKIGQHYAIQA